METDAYLLYFRADKKTRSIAEENSGGQARVMNKQLDELVKHGFVDKFSFDTKIPKVEYQLTPLGFSLLPIIKDLEQWGENNRAVLEAALSEKP